VASKELSRGDEQGELALARRAEPNAVPVEMIRRQKTAAAAFSLACQSSGLEDKEIYSGLGIDPGYFSRIKKGEATLQADLVSVFCELVGNRIYPEWVAYSLGCTLVQLQSEAERQLEIVREELAAEKLKVRVLKDAINGRAAA
jgi:hypothetical protein